MNRSDLNILAKEVFEQNKAKGFHDEEYSNEHYLCLVIGELMEAVEAHRKGRTFQNESVCNDFAHFYRKEADLGFKVAFLEDIKDTVSGELADAVIRLLDLAGLRGIEIVDTDSQNINLIDYVDMSFTEVINNIISARHYNSVEVAISIMIKRIEIFCKHLSIDLWQHVQLKMKYNQTREYKHGKRY